MSEEVRQKMMRVHALEQTLKQIQEHLHMLHSRLQETSGVSDALGDIEKLESGSPILVQVAKGVFAEATMKNNQSLKVSVGAGVVVEKSVSETKTVIDGQKKEIKEAHDQLHDQFNQFLEEYKRTQEELHDVQKVTR